MDTEKTPEEIAAEDEQWADQAMRQSELFYALKPDIAHFAKKRVPPQYVRLVDTRGDNEVHEEDDEETAEKRREWKRNEERWKQNEEDSKRQGEHWFYLLFAVLVVLPGLLQITGLLDGSLAGAVVPGLLFFALLQFSTLGERRNH